MDLTKRLITLAASASLFVPTLAVADDDRDEAWGRDPHHRHSSFCGHHAPAPAPAPPPITSEPQGRYELRMVDQWVEGQWVRDWVPERCVTKHKRRGTVTRCKNGYYVDRWQPGYYEQVQKWVWVPAPRPRFSVSAHF